LTGLPDLSLFWEYRRILLQGFLVNLVVFALSLGFGLAVAVPACALRLAPGRVASRIGAGWIALVRAAPEYVTLMWIYTVAPVLLTAATGTRITLPPLASAVLALGLGASGTFAEAIRAGIQTVPRGQVEAAQAIGLHGLLIFARIVLPQALRRMLPDLVSLAIGLFKTSTLVSVITVPDIMYQVGLINQQEMQPMPLYTGAALVFFAVISVLTGLAGRIRTGEA
jgi:polar amino acid transport system permease protein